MALASHGAVGDGLGRGSLAVPEVPAAVDRERVLGVDVGDERLGRFDVRDPTDLGKELAFPAGRLSMRLEFLADQERRRVVDAQ